MPAGPLPPTVVSGQPIASAWGNAVVENLGWSRVDSGFAYIGPHIQSAPGNIVHVSVAPNLTYDSVMWVKATCFAGTDSSSLASISYSVLTQIAGTNSNATPPVLSGGAQQYGVATQIHSWAVPAGLSPQFALSANWAGGFAGTPYTAAYYEWTRYRK